MSEPEQVKQWWKENDNTELKRKRRQINSIKSGNDRSSKKKIFIGGGKFDNKRFYKKHTKPWHELTNDSDNDGEYYSITKEIDNTLNNINNNNDTNNDTSNDSDLSDNDSNDNNNDVNNVLFKDKLSNALIAKQDNYKHKDSKDLDEYIHDNDFDVINDDNDDDMKQDIINNDNNNVNDNDIPMNGNNMDSNVEDNNDILTGHNAVRYKDIKSFIEDDIFDDNGNFKLIMDENDFESNNNNNDSINGNKFYCNENDEQRYKEWTKYRKILKSLVKKHQKWFQRKKQENELKKFGLNQDNQS